MAVSGDANLDYSITKTFQSSYQYVLMSYNQNQMLVKFDDWADMMNEPVLKTRLNNIPTFDKNSPEVVNQYQRLFRTLGSHVITSASYGGRFQLVSYVTLQILLTLTTRGRQSGRLTLIQLSMRILTQMSVLLSAA